MNLSVKQKLAAAFGSIILLMAISVIVVFFQVKSAHELENTIRTDDVPGMELYLTLIDESGDMQRDALRAILGDESAKGDFKKNYGQFQTALNSLAQIESSAEAKNTVRQIRSYGEDYARELEKLFKQSGSSLSADEMRELYQQKMSIDARTMVPMEKMLDRESAAEKSDVETGLNVLNSALSTMSQTMIGLLVVGSLIAIVIAYRLSASLTNRIEKLEVVAKSIAEGDLTSDQIVDNSGDELANLAKSINAMQDSLKTLLTSICEVSDQVNNVTTDLSEVTTSISHGAAEQADKASLISTASEELTLTIGEVAQQSVATAESASQSGDAAESGRGVILEMVGSIEKASTQMAEMSVSMRELNDHGEQIGSVIKVIEGIAEQTNLLALNAAIEAARAGESGRGFAVVADEVRALAERTTQATQEVSEIIQAIQQGTQKVMGSTSESVELVEKGVEQSAGAGAALDQIVSSATQVQGMIASIATATEEQTAVTQEIANDINTINDISARSLELVERSSHDVSGLTQRVDELKDLVSKFKIA
ncbi:methyl-accepting chemotaxis protein [Vibrio nigripulchritudo ATCC 27043]|uniref:methyl-accepting chemotaxis protein n=1 Tax=Vibrio TaxID=662 RepID=UPI00021C31F7|nr:MULTISPECIES: methyl-accepting chemotaxis protein [Vibrio]EGU52882.1 methyl-accepting chemotaxis protein [Vibrio nigripulchritudo ATCC 27043]UAB71800.1 methyl-accepting chemotaxis protein [Vibrio sp. SCSIO 43132]